MSGQHDTAADATRVVDTASDGGVAIFQVGVGYAIAGNAEEAIRRIYAAKQRSFEKPCGTFGNWEMFDAFIKVDDRAREVVRKVLVDYDLPLSIVAPFDGTHPFFAELAPFVVQNGTKDGTMDLLMNAGALHDEIARQSFERLTPVMGSSANASLMGSKFELAHVEQPVRAIADLELDYGRCKYPNDKGLGSSIIDLSDYSTVRVGAVYDKLRQIFAEHFQIELSATARD